MTIEDGRVVPDTKEAILDALVAGAESSFNTELNPDEVATIRSFYDPIAEYLATQQDTLRDVLDSAQIDHAEDQALTFLAASIGVQRKSAGKATTRLKFSRADDPSTTYSVPKGTLVQTDAVDPVRFETTEATSLRFIEGFEDGDIAEYSGDTGSWTVQTTTVYDGSEALQGPATTDSQIIDADNTIESGSEIRFRLYLNSNAVAGFLFGVQDSDSNYRAIVNDSAERIRLEKNDNGTVTTLDTVNPTIPKGEWLQCRIAWDDDGEITWDVDDAAGNNIDQVTATDDTWGSGGFGFYSGNNNDNKFFDNVVTAAASANAKAVEAGSDGNVGAQTLVDFVDKPSGIESVTNPQGATGGTDREEDADLRSRAKEELSEGIRGTQVALINRLSKLDVTRNVTVIANDTNSTDGAGRPAHSFEAVTELTSSADKEVAETILDTKAAGDTSVGGYAGTSVTKTVDLPNNQTKDITYSEPTQVKIYADVDLTYDGDYPGDDAVRDAIVRYIGGVLSSGENESGELGAGDDVIYNAVMEAIMNVPGVFDVTNLEIDTDSTPTSTTNENIASTEVATSDATDTSLDVSSSSV